MEAANFALTVLFALEMLVKVYGLHLRAYFRDSFNLFDFSIVIVSFVEIGLSPPSFFVDRGTSDRGGVSILRTLRLLRVLKLARSWSACRAPPPSP